MEMIAKFHEMNKEMIEILSKVPKIINEKEDELVQVDSEINDIKHIMELANLNASQGYKIFKDMQTALRKRRRLKDELRDLRYMRNAVDNAEDKLLTPMKNLHYSLDQSKQNKDSRTYSLRVRADFIPLYGGKCRLEEDNELKKQRRKEMNFERKQFKKKK